MFEWTERLAVGVEAIDAQHRELFVSINSLLRDDGGVALEEVPAVVAFLEEYVTSHFGLEEIYMRRLSYPAYPAHKGEHVAFIRDFYDLRDELEANGVTAGLADRMGRFCGDWLVNHVGMVDRALGAFLRERGKR